MLYAPGPAAAHEGHGDEAPPAAANAAPRVEAHSEDFELVGVAAGDNLTIYLDRFSTNEPITGATIDITAGQNAARAEPRSDGTYSVRAPWIAQPGSYNLVFAVAAGSDSDLLIGTLEIPALETATADARASWSSWLLAAAGFTIFVAGFVLGRLFAPRPLPPEVEPAAAEEPQSPPAHPSRMQDAQEGRKRHVAVGLACAALVTGMLGHPRPATADTPSPAATALAASDTSRRLPDGSVFVPKPAQRLFALRTALARRESVAAAVQVVGHVIADPNRSGRVQATQAGRVLPGEGGLPFLGKRVERGDVLAYIEPAISAVERSSIEQQLAEITANITIGEQRVARLGQLVGSVPQREIDQSRSELDGLRRRRAALQAAVGAREAIRAPASGVISVANLVTGQIVDAREVLFEIVDPGQLWVEAIAFDSSGVAEIQNATLLAPDGRTVQLAFIGRGAAARQQAIPLQFRIVDPPASLTVGRPVTVTIQTPRSLEGIALPIDSVVRAGNGQQIVWVHVSAERFVAAQVRVAPLDSGRVVVVSGIDPDQRVVTVGASLLNQIR